LGEAGAMLPVARGFIVSRSFLCHVVRAQSYLLRRDHRISLPFVQKMSESRMRAKMLRVVGVWGERSMWFRLVAKDGQKISTFAILPFVHQRVSDGRQI
jgi:hypothetical protein